MSFKGKWNKSKKLDELDLNKEKCSDIQSDSKLKSKKALNKSKVFLGFSLVWYVIACIILSIAVFNLPETKNNSEVASVNADAELLRAKNYAQLQDEEKTVNNTNDCVEFSASFLRDIDGDGYAEPLLGICKEIGKEDTLYMELNVKSQGYLKDGKITINGQNFYLKTVTPKDNEVQSNCIGTNIKEIPLNQINNGTQKLLTGTVRCGEYSYSSQKTSAIGNDIDNYSRDDNKI